MADTPSGLTEAAAARKAAKAARQRDRRSADSVLAPVTDPAGYAVAAAPVGFRVAKVVDRAASGPAEADLLAALAGPPQLVRAAPVTVTYPTVGGAVACVPEVAVTIAGPGGEAISVRLSRRDEPRPSRKVVRWWDAKPQPDRMGTPPR